MFTYFVLSSDYLVYLYTVMSLSIFNLFFPCIFAQLFFLSLKPNLVLRFSNSYFFILNLNALRFYSLLLSDYRL